MRLRVADVHDGLFSSEICCTVVGVNRTEVIIARREDVETDTIWCNFMGHASNGLLVEVPVATNEAVRRFIVTPDQVVGDVRVADTHGHGSEPLRELTRFAQADIRDLLDALDAARDHLHTALRALENIATSAIPSDETERHLHAIHIKQVAEQALREAGGEG